MMRWVAAPLLLVLLSGVAAAQEPILLAPAAEAHARPRVAGHLRIAVISDLNERYGDTFHRPTVHAAVERIRGLQPDIVLVTGDMVAGQRPGLDYGAMWDAFHAAVSDPLSAYPLAIAPGNHDASEYDRYAEEREEYVRQWNSRPRPDTYPGVVMVDDGSYPLRYAFTLGPALFVALDATARGSLDDDQIDWLEGILRSETAQAHPVRILFAHFPLLPFAQDREEDYLLGDEGRRARVERLLEETGVSAFVSGHHHAYYPGRDPEEGYRLVGLGCLGGGPRLLMGDERVIVDTDDPAERSFVVIQVADGNIASVEAYRGPDFGPNDRIDRETLPERVGLEALPIVRDDLVP